MKKNFFIFLLLAALVQSISALPGITQYIPDNSGEYVYYKDSSFARDTYVGFLYYDEGTYSVRYYAPAVTDKSNPQPEKNIEILFTMNTQKSYVELTGERILSNVTAEDTDLVNYMHDLLYELTSRRQKAGDVSQQKKVQQDYAQFGGLITITFEPLVPLFNIYSIVSSDGTSVFSLSTAGQLVSSQDTSFSSFKAFPADYSDKTHNLKIKKLAKKSSYTYHIDNEPDQIVQLDSQWTQSMDNLYLMGNSAILTMNIIKRPPETDFKFFNMLTRKLLLGTQNAYPDLKRLTVTTAEKKTTIDNTFYQPVSGSITRDFKIITKLNEDSYALFTLTVFTGAYTPNSAYFTNIVKNYTVMPANK